MEIKNNILFVTALLVVVIAFALIVYGLNGILDSESFPFRDIFALILGAAFGTGGVRFLKQSTQRDTATSGQSGSNGKEKDEPNQLKNGREPMPKPENDPKRTVSGDLSWLTFALMKELDFEACNPNHIVKTLKELGVPIKVLDGTTHDQMIRAAVDYIINKSADPRELLLVCANRIWLFEPRQFSTRHWKKFTELICRTYRKDSGFRKMVNDRKYLSDDFPIQDLLGCR